MQSQNKSLTRGLLILKEILFSSKPLTAVILCQKLDIDKSTMSRLLTSLMNEGFIKYLGNTKEIIKADILDIMTSKAKEEVLIEKTQDLLENIFNITNECTHLAIFDNNSLIYLNQVDNSNRVIKMRNTVGGYAPLHCTALGKIILAYSNVDTSILELEEYTSNTLLKKRYIDKTIEIIKNNSYAIELEEYEYGLSSLAFALFDNEKNFIGAIGISGLSARLNKNNLEKFAKEILKLTSKTIRL